MSHRLWLRCFLSLKSRREVQRQNLAAAGLHSRAAWINLNAVRFVLAFLTLVIGGFWLLMAPPQLEPSLLSFVVFGPLMMWALPPLLVSSKANERRIDIERGLPDVLDMLNMAVSQGTDSGCVTASHQQRKSPAFILPWRWN